jgi:hypothetical protein
MNWVHSARHVPDNGPFRRKTYVRKTMTDTASGGATDDANGSVAAIHQVTIDAETAGKRLDQALAAALPALSRSRLKGLIEAGEVSLKATADEARRTISEPSMHVKSGQVLIVCVPAAADAVPKGQAIPLDVVYEDEALIVVDKRAHRRRQDRCRPCRARRTVRRALDRAGLYGSGLGRAEARKGPDRGQYRPRSAESEAHVRLN